MLQGGIIMRCRGRNEALWGDVSQKKPSLTVMADGTRLLPSWLHCTHINWCLSCRVSG